MRATVFTDQALAKHAGRFVWLSIDTENEKNATYLETYPWKAVPTFHVIDPADGRIAYTWVGAINTAQLLTKLDEGEHAVQAAAGPADPPPDSVDAIYALSSAGKNDECAKRALALLPTLPRSSDRAGMAMAGLDCALSAEESEPWRNAAVSTLEAEVREATNYEGLISDDRAGLYASLIDARDRMKDEAGAKAAARRLLDFLEADARAAPNVEARAALDGYRVSAAIAAGDPSRALAPLEASERDLPDDYNPPARLAVVLRELGRFDEAIAASDRALAKAYGPRKVSILDARATIFEKAGNKAAAKATLEEALRYAATLPAPQRPKGTMARIEKRLEVI